MKTKDFFVKFKAKMAFFNFHIFRKKVKKKKIKKKRFIKKRASSYRKQNNKRQNNRFSKIESQNQKKIHFLSLIFLFTFSILLVYQNCSPPVSQGLFQKRSELEPYQEPMPFAYDASIDTLSYMSCSGIERGKEQGLYYTLKVGAYEEGSGVRLRDEFKAYEVEYSVEEILSNFKEDKDHINFGFRVQLAVRSFSNLGILAVGNKSQEKWDYQNIFPFLDGEDLMRKLFQLKEKERLRMIYSLPLYNKNRFFEGTLHFSSNESLAEMVRSELHSGEVFVALTFSKNREGLKQKPFPYIEDYEKYEEFKDIAKEMEENELEVTEKDWIEFLEIDQTKVYGVGYRLRYGVGLGMVKGSNEKTRYTQVDGSRVLTSIEEINLVTKEGTGRKWKCASYIVVRLKDNEYAISDSDDETGFLCPIEAEDPHNTSPSYQALRRVLSVDTWMINESKKCVLLKRGLDKCYLDTRTHRSEQAEKGKVYPHTINYEGPTCGKSTLVDCPHYVSVCYVSSN